MVITYNSRISLSRIFYICPRSPVTSTYWYIHNDIPDNILRLAIRDREILRLNNEIPLSTIAINSKSKPIPCPSPYGHYSTWTFTYLAFRSASTPTQPLTHLTQCNARDRSGSSYVAAFLASKFTRLWSWMRRVSFSSTSISSCIFGRKGGLIRGVKC